MSRRFNELPTQDYLREAFSYNNETGELVWRERPLHHFKNERDWKSFNSQFAEKIAGCISTKGYRQIAIGDIPHLAHRLVWVLCNGTIPADLQIDHVNNDRADNHLNNLRLATSQQNHFNAGKRSNNRSGFTGVSWHKPSRKWIAAIRINGKKKYLGIFKTAESAAACYATAAIAHHGKFIHGSVVDALPQPLQAALAQKPAPKRRRAKRPPQQLELWSQP
jgi:hypothetical protein